MKVLAIPGSLRRGSYNRLLLQEAQRLAPADVEFVFYEGLPAVPPFNEDVEANSGPAVEELRGAIASADGLLIATPEYNGSVPGQLKNALDWASRPFDSTVLRNKPAAVIGASTSAFGAVWAQAELRKVLATAGARVVEVELAVSHAQDRFDKRGQLLDQYLRGGLADVLASLRAAILERSQLTAA